MVAWSRASSGADGSVENESPIAQLIREAIEAHDVKTATRALEAHIRQSWERLREIYQQTTSSESATTASSSR